MTTTSVRTASAPRGARSRPRSTRPRLAPYLFSAPAVLLYVFLTLVPVGYTIWISFRAYRLQGSGIGGRRVDVFAGVENYATVFADPEMAAGFLRLLIYGAIAVPLTLGLALLFALLLDVPAVRAKRFSRTAIFIPYAVPGIVAALMWGFMYLPSTSPFSYITRGLGLGSIPFLENPGLFGSLANIAIWGGVGFNMIIIYTSLRGIPSELYESARLDGANERQIALRIKVPLVRPALILTGVFSLIGVLQLYGEPTTLRPLTSRITQTWAPLMTIYRDAFITDNLPAAAAASTVLALGTLIVSALVLWVSSRRRFGTPS
ncbi:multiple sugar transport system permease protein [Rathayibacter sp. PhB127]|uniref:carbohydrate ABC transporter permease n=1 Tax=Rathayibacter sp. PhB127 TaxID=2485176 RepID=UPI000F4CD33B|nr:sugar ABC transporter permease [Rathayibacter sp. PhB127]ROS21558.1 multiple sugar transport system permease protein [Rathayibacter sp. PhB127]